MTEEPPSCHAEKRESGSWGCMRQSPAQVGGFHLEGQASAGSIDQLGAGTGVQHMTKDHFLYDLAGQKGRTPIDR